MAGWVGCDEGTWDEHGMKEGREKEGGVYEIGEGRGWMEAK